ncbi:hypothetical protein RBB77_14220 [Tunturibacter psychrotolerans]|uniref:Uncharacterized protein n=1 Tax=Tunturiibacter psychrotolerans TaxID=3069686 RepID=A0AAU7ZKA1_9BACT
MPGKSIDGKLGFDSRAVLRSSEKSTQQQPPFQRRNTYLDNKTLW